MHLIKPNLWSALPLPRGHTNDSCIRVCYHTLYGKGSGHETKLMLFEGIWNANCYKNAVGCGNRVNVWVYYHSVCF